MKDEKRIQAAWVSYMDDVLEPDAPTVQVVECKRAFVAGAQAVLGVLTEIAEPEVSEDDAIAIVESMQEENRAFLKDVLEGRA